MSSGICLVGAFCVLTSEPFTAHVHEHEVVETGGYSSCLKLMTMTGVLNPTFNLHILRLQPVDTVREHERSLDEQVKARRLRPRDDRVPETRY